MAGAAPTISGGLNYTGGKVAGKTDTAWTAPKASASTAQFGQAQGVASDMMSGAAYDPYKAAAREAMARTTAQQRASVAGQINAAGLTGQGLGMQVARGSENDLMAQRFQNQLNSAIAEQQMKQAGATLGLNLEQQAALTQQNASANSLAARNQDINRELQSRQLDISNAGQQASAAAAQQQIELQRLAQQTSASQQDVANQLAIQQLALQRELGLGELGYKNTSLAQQKELELGSQGLTRQQLEQQNAQNQAALALQRELGLGELGYKNTALGQQTAQNQAALALQREIELGNQGLTREQLANQQSQFNANLAAQNQQNTYANQLAQQQLAQQKELELGSQGLTREQLALQQQIELGNGGTSTTGGYGGRQGLEYLQLQAQMTQSTAANQLAQQQLALLSSQQPSKSAQYYLNLQTEEEAKAKAKIAQRFNNEAE